MTVNIQAQLLISHQPSADQVLLGGKALPGAQGQRAPRHGCLDKRLGKPLWTYFIDLIDNQVIITKAGGTCRFAQRAMVVRDSVYCSPGKQTLTVIMRRSGHEMRLNCCHHLDTMPATKKPVSSCTHDLGKSSNNQSPVPSKNVSGIYSEPL